MPYRSPAPPRSPWVTAWSRRSCGSDQEPDPYPCPFRYRVAPCGAAARVTVLTATPTRYAPPLRSRQGRLLPATHDEGGFLLVRRPVSWGGERTGYASGWASRLRFELRGRRARVSNREPTARNLPSGTGFPDGSLVLGEQGAGLVLEDVRRPSNSSYVLAKRFARPIPGVRPTRLSRLREIGRPGIPQKRSAPGAERDVPSESSCFRLRQVGRFRA